MYKARLLKEKNKLLETNYEYIIHDDNHLITVFTNKGIIEIELPSSYPFSPPKIIIYGNLKELENKDIYLNNYLNEKFPNDICEKIKSFIYSRNEKIHIKKYFYENLRKYNNKDPFDIIIDFDNILQRWSPANYIVNILEFLEDLNKNYKIKDKYKFQILRN